MAIANTDYLQDLAVEFEQTTRYSGENIMVSLFELCKHGATQSNIKVLCDMCLKLAGVLKISLASATKIVSGWLDGNFAKCARYGIPVNKNLSKSLQLCELKKNIDQRFIG